MENVVTHLQSVSMLQRNGASHTIEKDTSFRISRMETIPHLPTYTSLEISSPAPCIWLPLHEEVRIILDIYVTNLAFFQHVVHIPSLHSTIHEIYNLVRTPGSVKPGHVILLLSIIASATFIWPDTPPGYTTNGRGYFLSSAQAHAQTPFWIKATQSVLNTVVQNGISPTLEAIQGIIILSLIVVNIEEGVSIRFRSLISNGILLGREMGLHRTDFPSHNNASADPLRIEVGRRVWWYLVATDWLMSVRYTSPHEGVYTVHPHQMTVNKPKNINDIDLSSTEAPPQAQPMSQPTDTSYFLQRIRLAEISQRIAEHNITGGPAISSTFELDQMIRTLPPFFDLDNYASSPNLNKSSGTFMQAYLLNSLLHVQVCKLHLRYLTSETPASPSTSRTRCLESARHILRGEKYLLESRHSFVHTRLRLSAILHGVFMATIVFLIDTCIHKSDLLDEELARGDLAEALKIVEEARSLSQAAAKLFDSMMRVLDTVRERRETRAEENMQGLTTTTPADHEEDELDGARMNDSFSGRIGFENIEWEELFSDVLSPFLL